jgi:hypothetical protein
MFTTRDRAISWVASPVVPRDEWSRRGKEEPWDFPPEVCSTETRDAVAQDRTETSSWEEEAGML